MDKHTRAEPGSRIRRAGRKIAKFRVKGERNEPTELGIYGFDGRIRVFQIEPRPHAVQPQVVLFIYHHADLVLHQQRRSWPRARLAFQTGQLLTHEMAFMQDLPIGAFHLIEPERDGRPKMVGGGRRFVHPVENRRAVLVFGPLAERNTANVAGQANAGGQDDGRFRTCGIEPAHAAVREQGEVHYSSTRMRSLSSAARSKFSPSAARCARMSALAGDLIPPADVLARAVQPPQQIAQVDVERDVALVAAEATRVAEIPQRTAALGTAQPVARRGNERTALSQRGEKAAERRLEHGAACFDALLLGALLAEVERDFGVMLDLRQVDDGFAFLTVVAEHQGIASTELTVASRPSSSKSTRSARAASWRLWVTTTTAVSYSRASRKNISCSRSAFAWSRFPDGSSASTTLGSWTSARATAHRCCSPPDSSAGR